MADNTINDAVTMAGNAEGTLLADRYRVVRQLGQGGMGSVWLSEDTQLDNKQFAIKMLPSILVSNKRAYRQLKDEALVAMKLVHPNIVTLRAFEENGGNPFLVMDYIDGETLDDHLAEKGKLTEDETIRILKPIAAALDYAHGEGVVHRDVKPANVMIRKDGHPYILDFGISREIQETMTRVTGKLSSGTLLYMSPEQLHGAAPKKEQDIYSFAAMAYECLKGEPPFSRGQIEFQIDNDTPEPLGLTGGAAILEARIMAGLAKKPEDRPPTCAAILEGKISRVEHVERVEKSEGGARSDGSLGKVFAVFALLTVLVAGGYYAWTKSRGVPENEESIASRQNVPAKQSGKPSSPEPKPPAEPKASTIEESDIIEIRVKAAKCENAMRRILDEDGFASKKASLSDDLAAARAYDNSRSWGRAAAAYTNYVNSYNALAQMNKDRIAARIKRDAAYEARQTASDASASQYAPPQWNEAERLLNAAKAAWSGMDFPDSAKKFDLAVEQYVLAKDEAVKERNRQVEEQREKERKAAAERERRKNWPTEGREFTIDRYSLGMTMKWCPAGSFTMGSPTTEEGRRYDVEAQHRVTLTKGFWMGETEVTQGQWKRLMDDETILDLARKGLQDDTEYMIAGKKQTWRTVFGMSKYDDPQGMCGDVSDDVPVYWVSWDDAVRFCRKLTAKERAEGRVPDGYEYRLPTEAEWEYACRAGETASLPNGMDIRILGVCNAPALDDIAWYGGNSSEGFNGGRGLDTSNWAEKQYPGGHAAAREVRSKRPNNWGLYDMIGNVWEWCDDWCGDYPYDSATNPTGPESGEYRIIRGGSWRNEARDCRPAHRAGHEPGCRLDGLGFRVALAPILSKDSGDVGASAEALASDKIQTNLVRVSANGGESAADTSWDALLYSESPQLVVHETQPVTLTGTAELQRKYNAKHGLSGAHRPSDDSELIEGKEDAESARLRREMVEQQRRRLYPEYYENHPQKNSGSMR